MLLKLIRTNERSRWYHPLPKCYFSVNQSRNPNKIKNGDLKGFSYYFITFNFNPRSFRTLIPAQIQFLSSEADKFFKIKIIGMSDLSAPRGTVADSFLRNQRGSELNQLV